MKTFRDLLEDKDNSEYGLTIYGEALNVSIKKAKFNDLMEINFSGSRILPSLKSVEMLKSEYNDYDYLAIDKIYDKITKKASIDIEKLTKAFEKDLNKIIVSMEKETKKL